MKLAEALQERADLNISIQQLKNRLENNAIVQEGEKPTENPGDLQWELDNSIKRLTWLISRINITNCSTQVNGQKATYEWKEQQVLGYRLREATEAGSTWTFTNVSTETPTTGTPKGVTKTHKGITEELEDYDTPLGVNVMINHVGDCFD